MPADTYTSLLTVEVDGTPLPDEVATLLERGRITDSADLPDSFELDFTDNHGDVLEKSAIRIGSTMRLVVSANGPQQPEPLLVAEVTALDREDIGGSLRTRVRGLDRSHRLFRGRRVAAYIDSTVADIVTAVAGRAGLKTGSIKAPGGVLEHVTQDNVSDWVFLKRLADASGCTFAVHDGSLDFGVPTDAADAPDGSGGARDDPVVIEYGVNTLYLRATVTSGEQVPEVEVRGWDAEQKQSVISIAPAKTRSAELAGADPAALAKEFGGPRYSSSAGNGMPAVQDRLAASVADRIAGGFAEVEAHILGNPTIRSGTAIAIAGFAAPFDGRYTVTESVHDFDSRLGYTTVVTVSNASDRSLYGVVAGGPGSLSRGSVAGVVNAIVTDNDDPDGRGRVKISFPTTSDDYVSGWARTVQAGAGGHRGWAVLPEIGDEVLVSFEHGRFDRPYVLGGLYNGVDEPKHGWGEHVSGGEVVRRSFTSRTGMVVEFVEEAGEERLELSTNDAAQKVTLLQTGEMGIRIIAEGPVAVIAKTDASIATESGTVTIKGANVAIEATSALDLKGATVKVAGDASAELSAASLALKGSATAELSSSGATSVKGATVLIN